MILAGLSLISYLVASHVESGCLGAVVQRINVVIKQPYAQPVAGVERNGCVLMDVPFTWATA